MPSSVFVSTTFSLEGFDIVEQKGVVRGIVVRAPTISLFTRVCPGIVEA